MQLRRPTDDRVRAFLSAQRDLAVTYDAVGASNDGSTPAGFVLDHNRQMLGAGVAAFERAKGAIRAWTMFPAPWTAVEPLVPIEKDQVVAVHVRILGLWWLNAARIVYVIDEPRRFGFAYGTLPGHAECGEERFLVEHLADDTVWYDLRAFSRPRHWMARLASPIARAYQRRFARASKAAMAAYVATR
ncbi:MAG TPA: DUF1990 domain-containing protein [Kofleriaceae bacterium]